MGAGRRRPVLHRRDEPGHRAGPGLGAQRKALSASERDEAARAAWRAPATGLDPAACGRVDESGSHLGLTRASARAPRGQRAGGRAPRNRGRIRTTVAALTPDGLGPGLVREGGVSARAFAVYVEAALVPTPRPGRVVMLDHLRQHRSPRGRALIEARGAELWSPPPYSPDLNPIAEACSKVKALLRAAARTHDALVAAIRAALRAITPADARGYITHAGYPHPPAQAA